MTKLNEMAPNSRRILYNEGQAVGRCFFINDVDKIDRKKRRALFRCICGNSFESDIVNVVKGEKAGCGCKASKKLMIGSLNASFKHGYAGYNSKTSSEYFSWVAAKNRCFSIACKDYKDYGGSGVTMCESWKNDFSKFISYMGPKPSKFHSLDRFPNKNGNYEPGNCRWATPKEQARNTRRNRLITYNGETKTMAQWAEQMGICSHIIKKRLNRGYAIDDVMYSGSFKNNFREIKRGFIHSQ